MTHDMDIRYWNNDQEVRNHSPEPWYVTGQYPTIKSGDDVIAVIPERTPLQASSRIDATRIILCVNACQGICNEDLRSAIFRCQPPEFDTKFTDSELALMEEVDQLHEALAIQTNRMDRAVELSIELAAKMAEKGHLS